jgi:hypothetical protein
MLLQRRQRNTRPLGIGQDLHECGREEVGRVDARETDVTRLEVACLASSNNAKARRQRLGRRMTSCLHSEDKLREPQVLLPLVQAPLTNLSTTLHVPRHVCPIRICGGRRNYCVCATRPAQEHTAEHRAACWRRDDPLPSTSGYCRRRLRRSAPYVWRLVPATRTCSCFAARPLRQLAILQLPGRRAYF